MLWSISCLTAKTSYQTVVNSDFITIRGARENNLQNISLDIPRDRLVVITGISGSGKSSLAFDTIYQEGQRRFLDSLSSYARQFLGQMHRPDVDLVEGLSPTLCIDQKTVNKNPRSTVGTVTELLDHLRLLMARLGRPHCPMCDTPLVTHSTTELTTALLERASGKRLHILAPIVLDRKGEYRKELLTARRDGFTRARVDGEMRSLAEDIQLARYEKHSIELVIDRVKCDESKADRIREAIGKAVMMTGGTVSYLIGTREHQLISAKRSCPIHGYAAPEMEPRLFSFNAPQGMCLDCNGLGYKEGFVVQSLFHQSEPIERGFIPLLKDDRLPFSHLTTPIWKQVLTKLNVPLNQPWPKLDKRLQDVILHGCPLEYTYNRVQEHSTRQTTRKYWKGVLGILEDVWTYGRLKRLRQHRRRIVCPSCNGARLNPVARAVRFRTFGINHFATQSIVDLHAFFSNLELESTEEDVGRPIIREIRNRLNFLMNVGLGYLSLHRRANTLSGGESQRIRLASQVGSGLQGVTYILDEPSIGLHQRDQKRLLDSLEELRNKGNSIIIVEHDPMTMSRADHLIEIGPGAGAAGGQVVQSCSRGRFLRTKALTARYIRGELGLSIPKRRREQHSKQLLLTGASGHNLQHLSVAIPLKCLTVITGVSGSGKSTLIEQTLCPIVGQKLHQSEANPLPYASIEGIEHIDKLIKIDQSPIGRSPRSNPATYTDVMVSIRELFASTLESKRRGYTKSRFSFNVTAENGGGRCQECEGAGVKVIEMQFLQDVSIECEVCQGQRFNKETLDIRYKGYTINDVLNLRVSEALKVFHNHKRIKRILSTLESVGLGYITLGQQSTTLSGGEAQRIKLAKELQRPASGNTLYVLDEPSTGLHMADVERLVHALQRLIEKGNSVVVIEHDLDIIKMADHIIDMGPEGGEDGGCIVGEGPPEFIATLPTHTGLALQSVFEHQENYYVNTLFAVKSRRKIQHNNIQLIGASIHNLKDVSVAFRKGEINVITGPSGSGKTSLAFHSLFAEGQRRYVESLSTYARRFLGRMQRPPIAKIEGLAPAIAIDQRNRGYSPRSTIATTTEIHDHLRLLFARVGQPHCPLCDRVLRAYSPTSGAEYLHANATQSGWVLGQMTGEVTAGDLTQSGFVRILDKGQQRRLNSADEVLINPAVVVDRFNPSKVSKVRIAEALEQAYVLGNNRAVFLNKEDQREIVLTRDHQCPEHGAVLPEQLTPRHFSFNTRLGACRTCQGLGQALTIEFEKLFPEPEHPFFQAIHGWVRVSLSRSPRTEATLRALFAALDAPFTQPVRAWSNTLRHHILYGHPQQLSIAFRKGNSQYKEVVRWEGLVARINEWDNDARWLRTKAVCPSCNGSRLCPEVLCVRINNRNIHELCQDTISEAIAFWKKSTWTPHQSKIVEQPLQELQSRLHFLNEVGVGYLHLNRPSGSLSGGESQRIRLATQLGSRLTKTIYVLDEPTIGLHPKDTDRLLKTLQKLKDLNNTLVIVEHDREVMNNADYIVDMGPAAGERGGEIVARGTLEEMLVQHSLTAQFLRGELMAPRPSHPRVPSKWIPITGFTRYNLQSVDTKFPRNAMTVVTGVSGSGKSTLVLGALKEKIEAQLSSAETDRIQQLLVVDQTPIGRSPRSTPATYCNIMDPIRKLFSQTTEAKRRGWKIGQFSYNAEAGRCRTCEGKGATLIEMHFLSDVWLPCPACDQARYNEETLEITWNGLNIADVLELSVSEAKQHFQQHRSIRSKLQALEDVGLGYLRLGQPSTELSGGEAQRLRLAKQLAKGLRAKETCLLLDEPTTGLHFQGVATLLKALHHLVEAGHMVVVIEHNIDVMWSADHLIDLGPEGGALGGKILYEGSPSKLANKPTLGDTAYFLHSTQR